MPHPKTTQESGVPPTRPQREVRGVMHGAICKCIHRRTRPDTSTRRGQEHSNRNTTLNQTGTATRLISTLFFPSHKHRRDEETSEAQYPYETMHTADGIRLQHPSVQWHPRAAKARAPGNVCMARAPRRFEPFKIGLHTRSTSHHAKLMATILG